MSVSPSAVQLEALASHQGPIFMLNLLKFREVAKYPSAWTQQCSGQEAYKRYLGHTEPLLAKVGGSLVYRGQTGATIIGPEDKKEWDEVLVVRYPSSQAMLKMIQSPEYQKIVVHRTAALEDSRLIITSSLHQAKLWTLYLTWFPLCVHFPFFLSTERTREYVISSESAIKCVRLHYALLLHHLVWHSLSPTHVRYSS